MLGVSHNWSPPLWAARQCLEQRRRHSATNKAPGATSIWSAGRGVRAERAPQLGAADGVSARVRIARPRAAEGGLHRIDAHAETADLVVQVRTGGEPGVADEANHLAASHPDAGRQTWREG